jgi:DNA-directed RNA polymerase specialized sigma24 family protein
LCGSYWSPIYTFVRCRGFSPEDAQDLIQGFFLHLLSQKALRQVSPLKDKFRSFLVASLQNYLSDNADRARCLKRGGRLEFVPLDAKLTEDYQLLAPLDFLTAEKIFDARWAIALLHKAMDRLRDDYSVRGEETTFQTLRPLIDLINSDAAVRNERAANALQVSVGSVKTLIYRLRKEYASLLCEEVARTVCDPREIDEEIYSLCDALIVAEGRLGP